MTKEQLTRWAELVALAKSGQSMTYEQFQELQILSGLKQMSHTSI